ncbi:hypothetical protein B0H14DRAFT_2573376 [Mycena olivaceomarginata]|nr:hypothetical protein B0H14DRAFT_2573376 [Mycena olivaceomarginata]
MEPGTNAPARSHHPQQPQNPFPGGTYTYPFYPPSPGPYLHAYYPPLPAPYLEPRPKSPVQAAVPTPSVSTDLDQDELPTLFPVIEDWLLELDALERGNNSHNLSQFTPTLQTNGFVYIIQLADEGYGGAATLQEICPGMLMSV